MSYKPVSRFLQKPINKGNDMKKEPLKPETLLSHFAEERGDYHGAVVPPLFQNSLFTFESWQAIDAAFDNRRESYIYSRVANPTVALVEKKVARLAGAEKGLLFASGMSAISAALLHFLNAGDHVITLKNIYGPANNLIAVYLKEKMSIDSTFVSGTDMGEFERAITPKTRLIYLESPTSATFRLQDIAAETALAQKHGLKTVIDNTWATPLFQKPLALGVDLEIHSCSKYLGGHSDLVSGLVLGAEADIDTIAVKERELLGGVCSPFEAWLILRSLRTLTLRMEKHGQNALKVAAFLEAHPRVRRVDYPGLPSAPDYALAVRQMSGFSGLLAFEPRLESLDKIRAFFNSLQIFQIGVSWGGHESLIYAPAISYLKELSPAQFKAMGISLARMRISVGLENADDLIADLDRALTLAETGG